MLIGPGGNTNLKHGNTKQSGDGYATVLKCNHHFREKGKRKMAKGSHDLLYKLVLALKRNGLQDAIIIQDDMGAYDTIECLLCGVFLSDADPADRETARLAMRDYDKFPHADNCPWKQAVDYLTGREKGFEIFDRPPADGGESVE